MDETPDDSDQPKVVPFPQHSRAASENKRVQDEVHDLLKLADADDHPMVPSRNDTTPPVVQVVVAPTEQGPPPGHVNGMHCPQCGVWAWKGSEKCWNCKYEIRKYLERQAARRRAEQQAWAEELVQNERQRWMRRAGTLALIGIGMMLSFTSVPAALSGLMLWGGAALLIVARVIVKLYE